MSTPNSVCGHTSRRQLKTQKKWHRNELIYGLRHGQFVPFFQPKIDLSNGIIRSAETLVRWEHPDLGMLGPSEFVAELEAEGLMDQMTEQLFCQLLAHAGASSRKGVGMGYAINVSALTLQKSRECDRFRALVREFDVPPERITIELTETAAAKDLDTLKRPLIRFRDEGFEISADDFGTGFSTLHQLSQIPFTEIKIDQAFVGGIFQSKKCAAILRSVVALANQLELRTVAEGIETQEQLDFVTAVGCTLGQGYLLGIPMAHSDLSRYMEREFLAAA